jgi:hypothetical protein
MHFHLPFPGLPKKVIKHDSTLFVKKFPGYRREETHSLCFEEEEAGLAIES